MYVLDTAGSEGRDPLEDFSHLQKELELYAPDITTRPSLIIANKMDEQGTKTATFMDVGSFSLTLRLYHHCRRREEPPETSESDRLGCASCQVRVIHVAIVCLQTSTLTLEPVGFAASNSALHKVDIDTVARTLRWMMENYAKLTKSS